MRMERLGVRPSRRLCGGIDHQWVVAVFVWTNRAAQKTNLYKQPDAADNGDQHDQLEPAAPATVMTPLGRYRNPRPYYEEVENSGYWTDANIGTGESKSPIENGNDDEYNHHR